MARLSFFALAAAALFGAVAAAPVPASNLAPRFFMLDARKAKASANSAAASSTATAAAAASTGAAASTASFQLQDYAQFQISDGVAGTAKDEADAIFVTPFANVDLSTVDSSVADDIETMRQAAEAAETDQFNPAIEAATGADADALQVGKIKNKVLKLTAEVQTLNIKLAKAQANGDDTASIQTKLDTENKKLTTNIATDTKSAGAVSKSVV